MIGTGPSGPDGDEAASVLTCHGCGARAGTEQRWRWSLGTGAAAGTSEGGRATRLCADCARANARSIEAQLDDDWW